MYKKLTMTTKSGESETSASINMASAVWDADGTLVYAELLGEQSLVKTVLKLLKNGRGVDGSSSLASDNEEHKLKLSAKGEVESFKLSKGMACGIYRNEDMFGKRFHALIGSASQIKTGFKKWMEDVNILPYFLEECDEKSEGEFRDELLLMMARDSLAYQAEHFGPVEYAIIFDKHAADGIKAMQQCILKTTKKLGKLGIDRLRARLIANAPAIGDMNDEFEVFAYFHTENGAVHRVIQYDKTTDEFFSSVLHEDGDIEWGQYDLKQIFEDPKIGFKLGTGEMIDMMGEKIKEQEAA